MERETVTVRKFVSRKIPVVYLEILAGLEGLWTCEHCDVFWAVPEPCFVCSRPGTQIYPV